MQPAALKVCELNEKDIHCLKRQIQYPGLEYQMKFDLATMTFLSRLVAWVFPGYRFEWMVTELRKTIACELDFIEEGKNSERTARNFKNNKSVKIPTVYWDFTSKQVLTMEFCEGNKVAKTLVDVFAEMIFVHGFRHGDPHPGNILVSPQGPKGFSLVILDHGNYKHLPEDFRVNCCHLLEALITLDSPKLQQLGEALGLGEYAKNIPVIFTGRTINSKGRLHLKEALKSLKMEDVSSFMESLSPVSLTLLRTYGLLRSLTSKLGASQQLQLLTYARCALRGLPSKASSGSAT